MSCWDRIKLNGKVNKGIDIGIKKNENNSKEKTYWIEVKDYVNTGQSVSVDFRGIERDVEKIKYFNKELNGIVLPNAFLFILLPHNTYVDQKRKYTKKMIKKMETLKIEYLKINLIFSKQIVFDYDHDIGFWVTWWSFNHSIKTMKNELNLGV